MGNNNELDPVNFYDKISSKYNYALDSNPDNMKIRDEVKQYFLKNVSGKIVLDFGGGSGKDLWWLIRKGFEVNFCEPSRGMREIAIKNTQKGEVSNKVNFISELNSNFQNWNKTNLPFVKKVDGILANFAVFNSIRELEKLSEKLALVSKENCTLIVSVLQVDFRKFFSRQLPFTIKHSLQGYGLTTRIKDGNNEMVVYLHTAAKLIKSFSYYFNYVQSFRVQSSTFRLFHFLRNDKEVV